ncbi:hypothetical protein [Bacillus thuringiensis]|nr:hypothetical protein [Bacillus thuringiensis]
MEEGIKLIDGDREYGFEVDVGLVLDELSFYNNRVEWVVEWEVVG